MPRGGSTLQILEKASSTDFNTQWANKPIGLPTGGTRGQILTKTSPLNYAASWSDAPTGGGGGGGVSAVWESLTLSERNTSTGAYTATFPTGKNLSNYKLISVSVRSSLAVSITP